MENNQTTTTTTTEPQPTSTDSTTQNEPSQTNQKETTTEKETTTTQEESTTQNENQSTTQKEPTIPNELSTQNETNTQNENQSTTQNDHQESQPTNPTENPNVKELATMFPQIQISIIQAVLAARNDDLQACIPDLLEMSDPTYKPSHQESMVRADEQLARQLFLHEEQQQQQPIQNLPYQPRIKRNPNQRNIPKPPITQQDTNQFPPQNDFQGKDEIQKIADEIGKLAETGKKTMSLWFNKAKAKMQEIQTTATADPHQSGSESLTEGYETIDRPNSSTNKPLSPNHSSTTKSSRITPNLPHGSRYQQTQNLNTHRNQQSSSSSTSALPISGPSSSTSRSHHGFSGYEVDETHTNEDDLDPTPLDEKRLLEEMSKKSTRPGDDHTVLPALPKKNDPAGIQNSTHVKDDDEESLEYTRNPFEDDD